MTTFEIADMTCGHCASTISKAVAGVDKGVKLRFELATHRVEVEPSTASVQALLDAIEEAGYTPRLADDSHPGPFHGNGVQRRGCCSGQ